MLVPVLFEKCFPCRISENRFRKFDFVNHQESQILTFLPTKLSLIVEWHSDSWSLTSEARCLGRLSTWEGKCVDIYSRDVGNCWKYVILFRMQITIDVFHRKCVNKSPAETYFLGEHACEWVPLKQVKELGNALDVTRWKSIRRWCAILIKIP